MRAGASRQDFFFLFSLTKSENTAELIYGWMMDVKLIITIQDLSFSCCLCVYCLCAYIALFCQVLRNDHIFSQIL